MSLAMSCSLPVVRSQYLIIHLRYHLTPVTFSCDIFSEICAIWPRPQFTSHRVDEKNLRLSIASSRAQLVMRIMLQLSVSTSRGFPLAPDCSAPCTACASAGQPAISSQLRPRRRSIAEHCLSRRLHASQRRGADASGRRAVRCSAADGRISAAGSTGGGSASAQSTPGPAKRALGFLERQFLPIGLLASLFVGYACPSPGLAAADLNLQRFATTGIFLLQVRSSYGRHVNNFAKLPCLIDD